MYYTLTITAVGTEDRRVTEHASHLEARKALIDFAGDSYRINWGDRQYGGTLTAEGGTGVHQASYVYTIRTRLPE